MAEPAAETTAAPSVASATLSTSTPVPKSFDSYVRDDPHIRNLAQESFSVNQPGKYTFLRVPLSPSQPALLEVIGEIRTLENSSCKMYTSFVSVSGGWLGDRAVHVRPLLRSAPGNNNIG